MRTSTRRHLATGLGALALAGSLAGCGSKGDASQTPTGIETGSAAPSGSTAPSGGASGASGGASAATPGDDASDGSSGTPGDGSGDGSSTDGSGADGSGTDGASSDATGQHTDGTYSATGQYMSPAGQETIGVSVTLKGDAITDVTVTPQAEDPTAAQFQQRFASGVAAVVVGKDIDDVQVGAVSGSSLTGAGFDTALQDIAAQSAR